MLWALVMSLVIGISDVEAWAIEEKEEIIVLEDEKSEIEEPQEIEEELQEIEESQKIEEPQKIEEESHNHTWIYNADEENKTITAVCDSSESCGSISFILSFAADHKEYDGQEYTGLTIEGEEEWVAAGLKKPSISYVSIDETGMEVPETPIEAGEYKAIVQVENQELVFPFLIHPVNVLQTEENITITAQTHTCSHGSDFQELTSDIAPEAGKMYYLASDITISNKLTINGNVQICLNGHKITQTGEHSIFYISEGGELTIYDCVGKGVLTGGKGDETNKSGSKRGGAVYIRKATLNMYGGTITGNSAEWGGAVFIDGSDYSDSTFNMYGGNIINNTATFGGGGVEVENSNSFFTMHAGKIENNKVNEKNDNLHKGGGVHYADGKVTIKGTDKDIVIKGNMVAGTENNLYLRSNKVIQLENKAQLGKGSSIGVSSSDIEGGSEEECITTGYGIDDSNRKFFLDKTHSSESYSMVHKGNELYIIKLPFEILKQPQNTTVKVGQNVSFNTAAKDCSYQWQVDKNDGNGFDDINGEKGETLTISNVTIEYNGYKYRCIFTKDGKTVNSSVAVLTVVKHSASGLESASGSEITETQESTLIPESALASQPIQNIQAADITVPVSRKETENIKDDVPKTGEKKEVNIWLWITVVSGLSIIYQKRKKYDRSQE